VGVRLDSATTSISLPWCETWPFPELSHLHPSASPPMTVRQNVACLVNDCERSWAENTPSMNAGLQ
jgi:hypothetical protein